MGAFLKSYVSPRVMVALAVMMLLVSVVMGRESEPPAVVALASSAPATRAAAEPAPDLELERLRRSRHGGAVADLFPARTPPAPPAPPAAEVAGDVASAEPAPPSAPPLPFTYLGQYIDGEKTEIFVAREGEHHTLEKGKTIDGQYKVEKIAGNAVTFVYLPSGTRQKLAIPVLK